MKKTFGLILLLFFAISINLPAQKKIYVTLFDNPEQEILLSDLSKITFNNGSMVFRFTNNSETNFSVSSVRRIAFVPFGSTDVQDVAEGLELILYPNPARDMIYLKNLSSSADVLVYSLQGALIKTQTLGSESESIDISMLNPGMYLLKVENSIFKFTKL